MRQESLHNPQMGRPSGLRTLSVILIVCAGFAGGVWAQPATAIAITPEPVGSGARALGQSAFIAVADDATAASWNPAGLINLERPEASFVGAWRTVTKDYSAADPSVSIDQDRWSNAEINFMSYAQPLEIGNTDVVLSINYHQVYDLGIEYNGSVPMDSVFLMKVAGESKGAISAYSLAGALSIPSHPEITIGGSFNWYTQSIVNDYAWQVNSTAELFLLPDLTSPLSTIRARETYDDFRGHNFTVGLLWDAYEKDENLLTLGLVCHTPFSAGVDQEVVGTANGTPITFPRARMHVDFPLSVGAGANYRLSDALSAAFDVQWTQWSEFKQEYADGTSASPISDDTVAFRLGGEWLKFLEGARKSVLACRGGLFYEPRPATADPDPLPVYGFSLGLGWTVMERFSLDFAYQFRWGEQDLGDLDYDMQEHFLIGSLITYF